MARAISNKRTGTSLYAEGFFGNQLRQWNTPGQLIAASPPPFLIVLRQRRAEGGGVCVYNLSLDEALRVHKTYTDEGACDLYFGEQVRNQPGNMALQGEYGIVDGIEHLFCSTVLDYMRPALERGGTSYYGASCRVILKQYLDLASYENMMELADCYPDHIIEFTTATENIGCEPKNTIIWEVRRY